MMLFKAELAKRVQTELRRLNVNARTFFRVAHIRVFDGRDPNVDDDAAQYELHGVVPLYVEKFILNDLKGETS